MCTVWKHSLSPRRHGGRPAQLMLSISEVGPLFMAKLWFLFRGQEPNSHYSDPTLFRCNVLLFHDLSEETRMGSKLRRHVRMAVCVHTRVKEKGPCVSSWFVLVFRCCVLHANRESCLTFLSWSQIWGYKQVWFLFVKREQNFSDVTWHVDWHLFHGFQGVSFLQVL